MQKIDLPICRQKAGFDRVGRHFAQVLVRKPKVVLRDPVFVLQIAAENARGTISGMLKGFGFREVDFQ